MVQLPVVYTIQANDALQQTGRLQEILEKMKTEKRIESVTILEPKGYLSILIEVIKKKDLILIVLTDQLEDQVEEIENIVSNIKVVYPSVGIGLIKVDNVGYDESLSTFQVHLRPIDNGEDLDGTLCIIEKILRERFPPMEKLVQQKKYKKVAGVVIGVVIILILVVYYFA